MLRIISIILFVILLLAFCSQSLQLKVIRTKSIIKRYHSNARSDCDSEQQLSSSTIIPRWSEICVSSLSRAQSLCQLQLPPAVAQRSGIIGKRQSVSISTEAYRSELLNYVRVVQLNGDAYNVLNFAAFPDPAYELPIFGADLVFLPGSSVFSIDFQPLSTGNSDYFTNCCYQPYASRMKRWQALLPASQPMDEKYQQYFSPYALFTSFPLQNSSKQLLLVEEALKDYLTCYADLLQRRMQRVDGGGVCAEETKRMREEELKTYLSFRIEHDPAKRLLTTAFGADWTDLLLNEVVFPMKYVLSRK